MPIYRYECQACGRRHQEILAIAEAAPESPCCQAPQRRLMPDRVRARVLEPGQVAAEQSRERSGELLARRADANRVTEALETLTDPVHSNPADPGYQARLSALSSRRTAMATARERS